MSKAGEVYTYFSIADGRPDVVFLGNGEGQVVIDVAFLDTLMLADNFAREEAA